MSELAIGNFTSCCRLCLSEKSENLKPLFDIKVDDKTLPEKISSFAEVTIKSNDKITTMVCNQCITIVYTWQAFRKTCKDNQTKLENWFHMWSSQQDLCDVPLHIKEEPMDITVDQNEENEGNCIDMDTDETNEEKITTRKVDIDTNGDTNELPPELTPFDCDVQIKIDEGSGVSTAAIPDNMCSVCSKTFSCNSNRRKHEKVMHGVQRTSTASTTFATDRVTLAGPVTHDERSQNSADSQSSADKEVAKVNNSSSSIDPQKIEFAAGLQLFQNSTPPISQENLSKIELSYIEKCKAMVNMFNSMECACHNVLHPNLKGLLSHLRAIKIWFPVFTCYNCMITFTDRSSSYRHNARCPSTQYESLIKLSNLRKRSKIKTRLYQNYKCTECNYMFFFHEDFCKHIREEHSPEEMPYTCKCEQQFSDVAEFNEHAYLSCFSSYYCDICFVISDTLEGFQKHATEVHDNSEGFVLLQDDNYRKKKPVILEKLTSDNEELSPTSANTSGNSVDTSANGSTGGVKRKSSYGRPLVEPQHFEIDNEPPHKKPNNLVFNPKATTCPICFRQYSSYANMMRHFKSHTEDEVQMQKDSAIYDQEEGFYCCPDCGGMFSTVEWDEHKKSHGSHPCSECGKVFPFQAELDQHRSVHLNLKLYRDSKTSNYKSTMLSPNSETSILVMCEFCEAVFQSKEDLKTHKRIHEVNVKQEVTTEDEDEPMEKKYECKPCNKQYSGYSGLWDHNKKKHPEIQSPASNYPRQCDDCDKVLISGGAWSMHKQMHERNAQMKSTAMNDSHSSHLNNANSILRQSSRSRLSSTEDMNDDNDEDESYFTCKKCFKVFSTKSNLVKHMKSHGIHIATAASKTTTKAKKVWCDVCHQSCDSTEALRKHKEEEHKVKIKTEVVDSDALTEVKSPLIYTCDVCTKTFNSKNSLTKHKIKHVQEDWPVIKKQVLVYCKYCKIPFPSVDLLNQHMTHEHTEEIKQKAQQSKQQQETKPKQFACHVCKKAFISATALHAHQGWHKRTRVEQHTKKHEKAFRNMVTNLPKPQQQPKFKCSTCFVQFPNDTALQVHILEKHRNVDAIILLPKCIPCNQEFETQERYEYHKRLHGLVETNQVLEQQQQQQQKMSKVFKCMYCPAGFSRPDSLTMHIRTAHSDVMPHEFKCNECNRTFDKQNALSNHLKVHEKQKSNTLSGKPSAAKPSAAKPSAAKPSVAKPSVVKPPVAKPSAKPIFSCSICNMGFNLPNELRVHTIKAHPF